MGGGGGGGRIALYYTENNFTGEIQSYGGAGNEFGGAGTIYMKSETQSYGDLIIDNNNLSGTQTYLPEINYQFDDITVKNKALFVQSTGAIHLENLNVTQEGSFYHKGGDLIGGLFKYSSGGKFYLDADLHITDMKIEAGGILTHSSGNGNFNLIADGSV